jgi:hypothetical protein
MVKLQSATVAQAIGLEWQPSCREVGVWDERCGTPNWQPFYAF